MLNGVKNLIVMLNYKSRRDFEDEMTEKNSHPDLFQDPSGQVANMEFTLQVGCRNKFGMTLRVSS
jgi:hypothetical protein